MASVTLSFSRYQIFVLMQTETHSFPNADGHSLAALLNLPADGVIRAYALFTHCFTCGKDVKAAHNIARTLTRKGIAVFRFDLPGLGQSEGSFSDTTFSSNVDDLYRAAQYLESIAEAPTILIGHSLGGSATLRAAPLIEGSKAVVVIAAPADPSHTLHLLSEHRETIKEKGEAEVSLGGRSFLLTEDFVKDLETVSIEEATTSLGKPLLILHPPEDSIVNIENAGRIYQRARHPKSFIALDGADHLLSQVRDSTYAANLIATWCELYLEDLS